MVTSLVIVLYIAGGVFSQKLNSTLRSGHPAYQGQEIIFYCETLGSPMAWQSDEYIGTGGVQLEFTGFDSEGYVLHPHDHPNTTATLISAIPQNGSFLLLSKLRIVASRSPPNASVTCHNSFSGKEEMISFHVTNALPKPDLRCTLPEDHVACLGQNLTFTCVVSDSMAVAWRSDDYIGTGGRELQLSIFDSEGTTRRSEDSPDTAATLLRTCHECTPPVITCQLNITILSHITHSNPSVTCLNVDLDVSTALQFQIKDCSTTLLTTSPDMAMADAIPTTQTIDDTQVSGGSGVIIAVVVIPCITIIATCFTIFGIYIFYKPARRSKASSSDNVSDRDSEKGVCGENIAPHFNSTQESETSAVPTKTAEAKTVSHIDSERRLHNGPDLNSTQESETSPVPTKTAEAKIDKVSDMNSEIRLHKENNVPDLKSTQESETSAVPTKMAEAKTNNVSDRDSEKSVRDENIVSDLNSTQESETSAVPTKTAEAKTDNVSAEESVHDENTVPDLNSTQESETSTVPTKTAEDKTDHSTTLLTTSATPTTQRIYGSDVIVPVVVILCITIITTCFAIFGIFIYFYKWHQNINFNQSRWNDRFLPRPWTEENVETQVFCSPEVTDASESVSKSSVHKRRYSQ